MSWTSKMGYLSTFALILIIAALTYHFCLVNKTLVPAEKWSLSSAKSDVKVDEKLTQPAGKSGMHNRASLARQRYLDRKNFTVVTAFFKIGSFQKGSEPVTRGPSTYIDWMWPYRSILNGVVAYFDDSDLAAQFVQLRRNRPTKVVMVDRSRLWAFSLLNSTAAVFKQANYPKNPPKSTSAEYVAAMNAKYELVARAARGDDPFGSRYIAWMDLGLYRELPKSATEDFMLELPRCHRDEAILFARVFPMLKEYTVESVMRNGNDWVGGGFFVARRDVAINFFQDYAEHVEWYLSQSLSNHDQSVLLAMYLPTAMSRPSVSLQAIVPPGPDQQWFYLAMQARKDGLATSDASSKLKSNYVECSYIIHL